MPPTLFRGRREGERGQSRSPAAVQVDVAPAGAGCGRDGAAQYQPSAWECDQAPQGEPKRFWM